MQTRKLQTLYFIISFFLLFILVSVAQAEKVKIGVAAFQSGKDAQISEQVGRAPYFLIFDSQGRFVEALENPSANVRSGAGTAATAFLAGKGVTLLIGGTFGPKMKRALQDHQIEYFEHKGVAHEVVKSYLQKQ